MLETFMLIQVNETLFSVSPKTKETVDDDDDDYYY